MIEFNPQDLVIIGTLIVLEGLLSADNALVLALLVRHLPKDQQRKALLYGLWGRSCCGRYDRAGRHHHQALVDVRARRGVSDLPGRQALYQQRARRGRRHSQSGYELLADGCRGQFTDIVFAVDSILVAVALVNDPNKLWIVYTGGFIGIIMLRMAWASLSS